MRTGTSIIHLGLFIDVDVRWIVLAQDRAEVESDVVSRRVLVAVVGDSLL
jgi:hypothetical protein